MLRLKTPPSSTQVEGRLPINLRGPENRALPRILRCWRIRWAENRPAGQQHQCAAARVRLWLSRSSARPESGVGSTGGTAECARTAQARPLSHGTAIHREWGEAQGNYDELRFFTGLRPSEEIALTVDDYDAARGTLSINKARVGGIDKCCTKTRQDRLIRLCPRAVSVLNCQLALCEVLQRRGTIHHNGLFIQDNGETIQALDVVEQRWSSTLKLLPMRYRKPLGELELDDWQKSTLDCKATRPQRRHDVAGLLSVDGRCGRQRH
jgi:hypothetical protein